MMLVAMDRSAGTAKRARAGTVDVPEALGTAVNKSLRATAAKNPQVMGANLAVTAVNKSLPATVAKNPQATEASLAATAEDAATEARNPLATTECPAASAVMMSPASEGSAESTMAAAIMTTTRTVVGRQEAMAVVTASSRVAVDMGRRAMVAGTKAR